VNTKAKPTAKAEAKLAGAIATLALQVRGNLPEVAPGVFHHRAPVAIGLICGELQRFCSQSYCSLIRLIHVFDVDVKKGWGGIAKTSSVADHHERIADAEVGGAVGLEFTLRTEHFLHEANQFLRLRGDNARSYCVPAFWLKMFHGHGLSLANWTQAGIPAAWAASRLKFTKNAGWQPFLRQDKPALLFAAPGAIFP